MNRLAIKLRDVLSQPETYTQIGIILGIYAIAFVLASRIRRYTPFLDIKIEDNDVRPWPRFISKLGGLIFPIIAIVMLRVSVEISDSVLSQGWVVQTALVVAILLLFNSIIHDFISHEKVASALRWLGIPLLALHLLGLLDGLIEILESMSVSIGNIEISVYGIARVTIFGSLLFWLGRVSSKTGREIISRQESHGAAHA